MRNTAKEFFSRENLIHPVVDENAKLREKLRYLEDAKSARSGTANVPISNMHAEAGKVAQEYDSYQTMTEKEIKKLRNLK